QGLPRYCESTCGVADGRAAEVDNGVQLAGADEEVRGGHVAVHPDRRIAPPRRECVFPDREGTLLVDPVAKHVDRLSGLGVVRLERSAAEEAVGPRSGTVAGVDVLERVEERGEVASEPGEIVDAFDRRRLPPAPD